MSMLAEIDRTERATVVTSDDVIAMLRELRAVALGELRVHCD